MIRKNAVLITFFIFLSTALLKGMLLHSIVEVSFDQIDNISSLFVYFGSLIGSTIILFFLIISCFLTYTSIELFNLNNKKAIDFFDLAAYLSLGLIPLNLFTIFLIIFIDNYVHYQSEIYVINTCLEALYIIWGLLVITLRFKVNIIQSAVAIFTPIILFELFKILTF